MGIGRGSASDSADSCTFTATRSLMQVLKAILVDDEPQARLAMATVLSAHVADIEVVGEAADVPAAVKLIRATSPDVVFLDIDMPGLSGLQLIDFFEEHEVSFQIVFVTAYSEYAIQAFECSAVDYLLKPIQIEQVQRAAERVRRMHSSLMNIERFQTLKSNLIADKPVERIALPVSDGILFVNTNDIMFLEADNVYTVFNLSGKKNLMISKPIKEFERMLGGHPDFMRTHRSYIINLQHVEQFIKKDGGYIVMKNGAQVPVSRERKPDLFRHLGLEVRE